MKGQEFILALFLVSAVTIGYLFYYIYKSSLSVAPDKQGVDNPTKKRFGFIIALTFLWVVLLSVTIPKSPYFLFADKTPAKVVYVAARQFSFTLSNQAIDPKNPVGEPSIEVPVGEPVEFRVTSLDVTHGFAIYNQKAELITQTQAMPGYVNRLRWEFKEPGTYNILCLEFCGSAHAFMRSSFTVK
ncbi:MAG: hypothetical protein IT239_01380 [Bacteroidia bacterium]|nr:hypothetical protein [Bacteroidia bacterium]